jgi:hypothetical protein
MKLAMFSLKGQNNILNIILVLGLIVVIAVLVRYNTTKTGMLDNMEEQKKNENAINSQVGNEVVGLSASDNKNNYMPVSGMATQTPQNSCNAQPALNPSELLPNDTNSEWANINPASNDLKNLNLLNPQQVIGINTVGSSLRNANLQVRSEPAIPKANVGPWNASTIETDTFRRPLEIGGCD